MTLTDLLPLFAQTGVFGVIAWVGVSLHRSAIRAHQERVADWKAAAGEWRALALERERQLNHIVTAVDQTTTGQAV